MINTYGMMNYSVRACAFELLPDAPPEAVASRDRYVRALKIHNTILNFLGYLPNLSPFSGTYRIVFGAYLTIKSFKCSTLSKSGAQELYETGISQIEGFTPMFSLFFIPVDIAVSICRADQNPRQFIRY
jgi:hypothetical protein